MGRALVLLYLTGESYILTCKHDLCVNIVYIDQKFNVMKQIITLVLCLISGIVVSQSKKVLVYTETNGFVHSSIEAGVQMITSLGNENGDWTTVNSNNSSVFTTNNLMQYDAVVFLNTSGTDEAGSDGELLNTSEKTGFENFISSGKGFVGIHSATDTYRDGVWPFYNELVGGIVQNSPIHTNSDFNATLTVKGSHQSVDFLGGNTATWDKTEEYYYWELNGGQLCPDNIILLEVEQTIGPNGEVNSYDSPRPISWYKTSMTVEGSEYNNIRSFYTALGHNSRDYTDDSNFKDHIKNAILWSLYESTLGTLEVDLNDFKIFPNPASDVVEIHFSKGIDDLSLSVYNTLGEEMFKTDMISANLNSELFTVDLSNFSQGVYLFSFNTNTTSKTYKVVKL